MITTTPVSIPPSIDHDTGGQVAVVVTFHRQIGLGHCCLPEAAVGAGVLHENRIIDHRAVHRTRNNDITSISLDKGPSRMTIETGGTMVVKVVTEAVMVVVVPIQASRDSGDRDRIVGMNGTV